MRDPVALTSHTACDVRNIPSPSSRFETLHPSPGRGNFHAPGFYPRDSLEHQPHAFRRPDTIPVLLSLCGYTRRKLFQRISIGLQGKHAVRRTVTFMEQVRTRTMTLLFPQSGMILHRTIRQTRRRLSIVMERLNVSDPRQTQNIHIPFPHGGRARDGGSQSEEEADKTENPEISSSLLGLPHPPFGHPPPWGRVIDQDLPPSAASPLSPPHWPDRSSGWPQIGAVRPASSPADSTAPPG